MSAVFDRPDAYVSYRAIQRTTGRRPFTLRYAGVLAVWSMLFLVRPKLALEIFRTRRADSPIPKDF